MNRNYFELEQAAKQRSADDLKRAAHRRLVREATATRATFSHTLVARLGTLAQQARARLRCFGRAAPAG